MADINIIIPYNYAAPTEQDVRMAKRWTRLRNENAAALAALIHALLEDAAAEMARIGFAYNIQPEQFQFSEDKRLREEIARVLDELKEKIMALIEEYALNVAEDDDRRRLLLPWLLALHSRGAKDLRGTLHLRLTQFMRDTEAQIAAMRMAGYDLTKAVTRIRSTIRTVYATPEVQQAYRPQAASLYLRSRGVHAGNIGLSSSGAVNVENFAHSTAIQAWEHNRIVSYRENGIDGFWVARGSNYPCESICDQQVGFHLITEIDAFPPFHGHCCCIAIPIRRISNV